jgi:hypothetical protein
MLWYGFLVMRDEHAPLACRQDQDLRIAYPCQPGSRCGLEIECGLPQHYCMQNDLIEIGICLKA